jgi:hypothetical protein
MFLNIPHINGPAVWVCFWVLKCGIWIRTYLNRLFNILKASVSDHSLRSSLALKRNYVAFIRRLGLYCLRILRRHLSRRWNLDLYMQHWLTSLFRQNPRTSWNGYKTKSLKPLHHFQVVLLNYVNCFSAIFRSPVTVAERSNRCALSSLARKPGPTQGMDV